MRQHGKQDKEKEEEMATGLAWGGFRRFLYKVVLPYPYLGAQYNRTSLSPLMLALDPNLHPTTPIHRKSTELNK